MQLSAAEREREGTDHGALCSGNGTATGGNLMSLCVCDRFIRKTVEAATGIDPERAGGQGSGFDQRSLRGLPGP